MQNCKVKVLFSEFPIEFLESHFPSDFVGYCWQDTKRIAISSNRQKADMAETLWHELLHAMWYKTGLKHTPVGDHQELIVHALSSMQAQFFKDNQDFMHKLIDEFKDDGIS